MSRSGGEDEEEAALFYESLERIPSSETASGVNSEIDEEEEEWSGVDADSSLKGSESDRCLIVPKFPMAASSYEIWMSEPVSSIEERRCRLLRQMGLNSDPALSRVKCGRSSHQNCQLDGVEDIDGGGIHLSNSDSCADGPGGERSEGEAVCSSFNDSNIHFVNSNIRDENGGGGVRGNMSNGAVLNKPPIGRNRNFDSLMITNTASEEMDVIVGSGGVEEGLLRIKNLDNGKEFVVNGVREDGMCSKLKEVGTGKQLTMEEFDLCAGHSPIVQELMRRQNVEEGNKDHLDPVGNGQSGLRSKKRGSWLKNLRSVTSTVAGYKERRSSDERDNSSDRGGQRSSSATDDSQDIVFHGPERVKVRQIGKSCKELSALYKSQEICAHNGSIWSIKFSLDGRYLASAGEDCVIHVWQVVGSERKGDLLTDDVSSNILYWANGSPGTSSPILDNPLDKKRRNRSSLTRKSLCMDNIYVPETVFALSDKPFCSFQGHTDDVLDLSWSKSQHLLSSSMDKTVRLWHLSSQSCLKIFSHNDYVTCIHFNPADDRYFISGSLDAKVRIWSITDHQVVDWIDLHEMVTAACYTPDGQGALVGSYKGSCRQYSTTENKLVQKKQINLQNKKKKSHQKKITGFQFTPGSQSEVLVTSADSRIRVIDGVDLVHKFKGFRNAHSQISASITMNGRYIVAASEDSNVYVWKHEADSRPRRSKTVAVTQAYENFHCQDVSVSIPWFGADDSWSLTDVHGQNELSAQFDKVHAYDSPTGVKSRFDDEPTTSSPGHTGKFFGVISKSPRYRISETVNDQRPTSTSTIPNQSPRLSTDLSNGVFQNKSAWGMVIITGSLRGELRTFQNFGLPV